MPLGDSITAGVKDPNGDGYRRQLYQDLTAENVNFKYVGATTADSSSTLAAAGDQYDNGYGSYTISDLTSNLGPSASPLPNPYENYPYSYQPSTGDPNMGGYWLTGGGGTGRSAVYPNVVLLQAGANDLGQGETLAVMESKMTDLLHWFQINRPNTTMIIGNVIPQYNQKSINDQALAFNSWLSSAAPTISSKDHVIDLYDLFVTVPGSDSAVKTSSSPDGIYLVDGVHPSTNGYNAIGNSFNAAIISDVPEPSTWALLLGGVAGLFVLRSRLLRGRSMEL